MDPAGAQDAATGASAVASPPPAGAASAAVPPGRLVLVGTGHVFRIGDAVADAVRALRPAAVFVELDRGRLDGLLARRRGEPAERGGGFVHRRMQRFQEEVAGLYGAEAGEEMLAAVLAGHEVGAQVHLVDVPVERTLRRVAKEMRLGERLRLVGMLVGGALKSLVPGRRRHGKQHVEAELKRYQEDPEGVMEELRRSLPTVHRVLIAERDETMARRIRAALPPAAVAVAFVGDGHVPGMLRLLAGLDITVHRLADVRAGRLPRPGTGDAHFTFETRA